MKLLYTIFLVVVSFGFSNRSNAQELNVIAASGGYSEGAVYSMSYTIGEAIVVTAQSGAHHITQGFQQSDIAVVGIEELQPEIDITVYPNPANDFLNISSSENTKLTMYDMQGKLVRTMDITSSQTQIDVSDLSRGTYSLVFEANGYAANRMKIVIL